MIGLIVFGVIGLYGLMIFGGLWMGVRHSPSLWVRMAVLVGVGVPLFALPLVDEIVGKRQFEKLCSQLQGVKYYGKIQLGPEFYFEDGTPKWRTQNYNLSEANRAYAFRENELVKYVRRVDVDGREVGVLMPIAERSVRFENAITGELLAEYRWYSNKGGWLNRPWGTEHTCGLDDETAENIIFARILQPKH